MMHTLILKLITMQIILEIYNYQVIRGGNRKIKDNKSKGMNGEKENIDKTLYS